MFQIFESCLTAMGLGAPIRSDLSDNVFVSGGGPILLVNGANRKDGQPVIYALRPEHITLGLAGSSVKICRSGACGGGNGDFCP